MMRRAPETDAERHHHTPVSYQRRFSFDGSRVFVYDRITRRIRRDNPINVAVEKEFNTVVTMAGAKSRWAESRLGELDGIVKPLLDKLEHGEPLTKEERWYVSFFIAFGETRGGGYRAEIHASGYHAELEEELRVGSHLLSNPEPQMKRRVEAAFAAATGVWIDGLTIERMAREELADIASGGTDIMAMVAAGGELSQFVFHAGWVLVTAPDGVNFVTSDRPLGLWRPNHGFGEDPLETGVLKLFPISPRHALLIGNSAREPFMIEQSIDAPVVRLANVAIFRRSYRYLIGSSRELLEGVLADATRMGVSP